MQNNSRQILISPLFLIGLFVLLLNDFVLKAEFHNFLTGKLSDFAGLFIFPLFLSAFFSKRKLPIYTSTGFLFVFWKSPFSESLIDFCNSFALFKVGRTIDYTDLLALSVLPVSYFYFKTKKQKTFAVDFYRRGLASFVIILSVFAFTATSLVKDRTISLSGEYKFAQNKSEIENILRQNPKLQNIRIRRDDEVFDTNKYPNMKIDKNTFHIDFLVRQKFCDSERPKFSFILEPKKDFTVIRGIWVNFECKLYEKNSNIEELKTQHHQELNIIFEREVIERLRQNNLR